MKEKFFTISKLIIFLGVTGIAFNILFGENTNIFLQKEFIGNTTIVWYKYDIHSYINQLETAITDTTALQLKLPTRQWIPVTGTDWWNDLIHDLAVMLNYIIMILNVLLYPLKIGGYLVRFILAILGLNYNDPNSSINWLGQMCNTLIGLTIPYV